MTNSDKCEAKSEQNETIDRRLAAGTVIQIGGLPFRLERETVVSGHPANFALAAEMIIFPPTPARPKAIHSKAPQEFGSVLPQ